MDKVYILFVDGELTLSTTRKSRVIDFINQKFEYECEIWVRIFKDGVSYRGYVMNLRFESSEEIYLVTKKDLDYIKENF